MAGTKKPTMKRTTKRYVKKTYRKPRKMNLMKLNVKPFPLKNTVNMRYVTKAFFNLTTSSPVSFIYRANSIYDPEYAVGGNQPLGHDQWGAVYNHYIVLYSKINVRFIPFGSNHYPGMLMLALNDDAALSGTIWGDLEQNRSKYKYMDTSFEANSTGQNLILKRGFNCRKFFDVKDVKDNVSRLGADFGANPTEQCFYILTYSNLDTADALGIGYAIVTIDYVVEMSEPKDIPES